MKTTLPEFFTLDLWDAAPDFIYFCQEITNPGISSPLLQRCMNSSEILREKITSANAYKIARKLEKAGYIKSFRGSAGGYALNCDLEKTTLYDIITVIDPRMLLIECMQAGYECPVHSHKQPCHVHREFARIQSNLNQDLKKYSLAKILSE